MINLDDTRTLLGVVERSFKPTTTLVDTFFPEVRTFVTETVEMEYRKGTRKMAPFVVPGTKGVNMARNGSQLRVYKAPLMKPKRVIEASDIMRRGFGETVYSQRTPAERAQALRAYFDVFEAIFPVSSVRNSPVTLSPFKITCCTPSIYSIVMSTLDTAALISRSSSGLT